MTTMPAPRNIDDNAYLSAQIDCLRVLIVAIAGATMEKDEFREAGLAGLERLRITTLNMPTDDAMLTAIDHAEAVLKALTE